MFTILSFVLMHYLIKEGIANPDYSESFKYLMAFLLGFVYDIKFWTLKSSK